MNTRSDSIVREKKPLDQNETEELRHQYLTDGFAVLRNVLHSDEIAALIPGIDRFFADESNRMKGYLYFDFLAKHLFESGLEFENILTREPIISLVEAILGDDCHLLEQVANRNYAGMEFSHFHVDDFVIFPLPDEVEHHDFRITLPPFKVTVMIPLTDIPSTEFGPTQYIPGSHYSGRFPKDSMNPNFCGREPVTIFCKAGDIYLHNGQTWHRPLPNNSDRVRYLLQLHYGVRWIREGYIPQEISPEVLARADRRRRRVLGFFDTYKPHPQPK